MIPLVICSGPRVLAIAAEASEVYAASGQQVTIVRPAAAAHGDAGLATAVRIIDDEDLAGYHEVKTFLESERAALVAFNRAPGWYLQQYLKLAVSVALEVPRVFVSDGDTIFSPDLLAEIMKRPKLLTTGEKYQGYDNLARALGVTAPRLSCVANGNFFSDSPVLRELGSAAAFIDVIRQHVLPSQGRLDFSEYQLAGSVQAHELGFRPIRLFRRFDLLVAPDRLRASRLTRQGLRRYDAIAFEVAHDRGIIRQVAAKAFYAMGKAW